MRLFFKHLLVSIKRKPLQPLILSLTIAIAIAVSCICMCTKHALHNENELSKAAQYGKAELAITLNSDAASRFMFAHEANELLGERGYAVGAYEIVLSLPEWEGVSFGAAVDFYEINKMFDLRFSAYGEVTNEALTTTAFITEGFAREHGLRVGDHFGVRLFSRELTYTVGGISRDAYLGQYPVIIDIRGAVKALAADSVIASAMGEGFQPSSILYVDVADGYDAIACMESLQASPAFGDKTYTDTAAATKGQTNVAVFDITVNLSIVLVLLLAMAVSFCCFYILGDERREENQSFVYAGAKPVYLHLLQFAEVTIYWLVGALVGVPLAALFGCWVDELIGLRYAVASITPQTVLLSVLFLLAVSYLTTGIFVLSRGKRAKKRESNRVAAAIPIAAVALAVGTLLVPPGMKIKLGVAALIVTLLCMFVFVPKVLLLLLRAANKHLDKRAREGRACAPALVYAVKNIGSVKLLHNVARLGAMLIAVVLLAATMIVGSYATVDLVTEPLQSDYVIVGAAQRCRERILQREEIKGVESVYFSTAHLTNHSIVTAISAESCDTLSAEFGVTRLPEGKGAVISRSVARQLSLKVGDSIAVVCDNKPLALVVEEIAPSPMAFVLFDCEEVGIRPNLLIPIKADHVDSSEALQAASAAIAEDVATILPTNELLGDKLATVRIYCACGNVMLTIIVAFALIGLADSLYNSYRARRGEMALFAQSGMSRKEIRGLKAREILLTLLVGAVIALALCAAIAPVLNEALLSEGNDISAGLAVLFRGK